ncbi:MAG: hypothetical protein M0Z28_10535, partial [Rhodospirillales bacterium]|nr:hypothetical protein [Rhodospirillales bacterium]
MATLSACFMRRWTWESGMLIRSILVPLYGKDEDATTLAAAADIALPMRAHVMALFCESDITEVLEPVPGWEASAALPDSFAQSFHDRAEAQRKAAERRFSEWLARSGMQIASSPAGQEAATAELVIANGRLADVIRDYAVVADLVVMPIGKRADSRRFGMLEAALFDCGRPVLGVPPAASGTIFRAPVAIAWNYSAEAARALNAALPVIARVGEAVVLLAGHHEDEAAARRVVSYLGWHGVKASVLKLDLSGPPAELIAAKARELGAGL